MAEKKPKKRFNGWLDADLVGRIEAAIYHVGRKLNLRKVIERGALLACEELERKHNKGKPFPPVPEGEGNGEE